MKHILIDSDILIDVFLERIPFNLKSTEILNLCSEGKLKGYITSIILANTIYILSKYDSNDNLKKQLLSLMKIIDVVITDKSIILNALNSNFNDLEDALQNYSAESNSKIDTIITRNIKDYKHSKLAILTPEEFLVSLL